MRYTELTEKIQNFLVERGLTLATAESCTGGKIASELTSVPGSSAYFIGSIVAYQNYIKTGLLGVEQKDIDKYNVVSKQVVEQMVIGACKLFKSDFAISTSGCAGPGGGTDAIPVGTIWIAVGNDENLRTVKCTIDSGRLQNIENAVETALENLLRLLEDKYTNCYS